MILGKGWIGGGIYLDHVSRGKISRSFISLFKQTHAPQSRQIDTRIPVVERDFQPEDIYVCVCIYIYIYIYIYIHIYMHKYKLGEHLISFVRAWFFGIAENFFTLTKKQRCSPNVNTVKTST